jgi:hypothetical protein
MFATSAKFGAVPDLPGKMVDWIPVDVAAQSIVEILTHPRHASAQLGQSRPTYTVHNIVNPQSVPWTDIVQMLQRSDAIGPRKALRTITMLEWVALLNKAADDGISPDELPGLRLLGFFQDMAARTTTHGKGRVGAGEADASPSSIVFDTRKSRDISPTLAACQGYCSEWLEASMKKWREEGLFSS